MNEWLDDFYGEGYRTTLLAAFGPLFARFARSLSGTEAGAISADFVSSLAASYVDHHLNSSRIQLQELVKEVESGGDLLDALTGRFDEWQETRPDKVAANETRRASNALAVQQLREAGVERKVWTTGGDSCPFCAELDGTVVEIDRPFFTPDDEYQPKGADAPMTFTSSIGHPPIHQGCGCSIEAG